MKLVVYGIILCSAWFVYPAHALTTSQSSNDRRSTCCSVDSKQKPASVTLAGDPSSRLTSEKSLVLAPPPETKEKPLAAEETIKSLASGDSLVNPWFPGKGAIGVRVKVTW